MRGTAERDSGAELNLRQGIQNGGQTSRADLNFPVPEENAQITETSTQNAVPAAPLPDDDIFYSSRDVRTLKGVGPAVASKLSNQNIHTLFDVLLNLPFRFLDKTRRTFIKDLRPDGSHALVAGTLEQVQQFKARVTVLRVTVRDETGYVSAVFFNPKPYFTGRFRQGERLQLFGAVMRDNYGKPSLQHPEVTFLAPGQPPVTADTLTPVYHSPAKTPQSTLRKLEDETLDMLDGMPLTELIPRELNPFYLSLTLALKQVHHPAPPQNIGPNAPAAFFLDSYPPFQRICFEELCAYLISLLLLKRINRGRRSPALSFVPQVYEDFTAALPYKLTNAQQRSFSEICQDLQHDTPMLRLLHGDVGSGKTLVAILAALQVAKQGYQIAVLAPTELLAAQHFKNFDTALSKAGITTVLLTGSLNKAQREETLSKIKSGGALVIVGTHALFQSDVTYKALALAVIDEQHRFGTKQRVALLGKAPAGLTPHQLVMTATPIPRTQQLALYADLDVSTLDELPKGRVPVQTAVMPEIKRPAVIERVRQACQNGCQVYWVCRRIEDNDEDDGVSVKELYKNLSEKLPGFKLGLLHGQLKAAEKDQVMREFAQGNTQILVATTIVEVGVDVPNANIIVIEEADKLGLAQLHQLRGRVGRGQKASFCILLYKDNQDSLNYAVAQQRLMVMRSTTDGFKIAAEDLKLRGPGEVLGREQSGFKLFRIADVFRDSALIPKARETAEAMLTKDPALAARLLNRWFPEFKGMSRMASWH